MTNPRQPAPLGCPVIPKNPSEGQKFACVYAWVLSGEVSIGATRFTDRDLCRALGFSNEEFYTKFAKLRKEARKKAKVATGKDFVIEQYIFDVIRREVEHKWDLQEKVDAHRNWLMDQIKKELGEKTEHFPKGRPMKDVIDSTTANLLKHFINTEVEISKQVTDFAVNVLESQKEQVVIKEGDKTQFNILEFTNANNHKGLGEAIPDRSGTITISEGETE
uniref:Uncharacterized protein n=1 Tax=viral metagenome TaxID=1070528 RepID=A0A6M3IKR7_9ZZZZ